MDNRIWLGLMLVTLGVIQFLGTYKKWSWMMNDYQNAPMREALGEDGFAMISYFGSAIFVAFGFMMILNLPIETLWR